MKFDSVRILQGALHGLKLPQSESSSGVTNKLFLGTDGPIVVSDFVPALPVTGSLMSSWELTKDAKDYVGELNGSPVNVSYGTIGGRTAAHFNGYSSYVELPDLNIGSDPWTVQMEYYPKSFSSYTHLFSAVVQRDFALKLINDGSYGRAGIPYFHTGDTDSLLADRAIPLNAWSLLTFTYDGSYLKIYIDNSLAGSHNVGAIDIPSTTFRIGNFDQEWSHGYQRNTRYYSRAISASEVETSYSATQ